MPLLRRPERLSARRSDMLSERLRECVMERPDADARLSDTRSSGARLAGIFACTSSCRRAAAARQQPPCSVPAPPHRSPASAAALQRPGAGPEAPPALARLSVQLRRAPAPHLWLCMRLRGCSMQPTILSRRLCQSGSLSRPLEAHVAFHFTLTRVIPLFLDCLPDRPVRAPHPGPRG